MFIKLNKIFCISGTTDIKIYNLVLYILTVEFKFTKRTIKVLSPIESLALISIRTL